MTAKELAKTYQPQTIETKWYQTWEKANYFKPSGQGKPFCIVIPPPNITGSLHMGHAFEASMMDAITRYHKMNQDNTLWQVGTDHAGIATQMVVERQLAKAEVKRVDIGRDAFVDRIWDWKQTSGQTITHQLRRMGAAVDWERERFTLDAGLSQAVIKAFVDLFDEGLIYRGNRLVNWDPVLHTAISDLEVITKEENGWMWTIRYPLATGEGYVTVATTRPETLFGDVAVAVHPDDDRYKHLIGQQVKLPLTERTLPIIADTYVDMTFGTGCLKITPAHDFNDYEVGKRHGLEPINIFTPSATLNIKVPPEFQGLEREQARKQVVNALTEQTLLVKTEPHTLAIPRGDRSDAIIEPYLTPQWYVKVESLAKPAIEVVEKGELTFVPEGWKNTYYAWMRDLNDWCISRQLWWGHRIPAWYDKSGNVYVAKDEQSVRDKYHLPLDITLQQDPDVLDTWFSSALWPFSTLGWPEKTPDFNTFYPTNLLITGFDIIFFWVARMIMFGLKFTDQIPFKEVYIHGLILDAAGNKMSKSKGNVIDPLDLIDGISLEDLLKKRTQALMQPQFADKVAKDTRAQFPNGIQAHGTDALRFTFCSLASTGRAIVFDMGRLEGNRNFCNKLWNAARYVLLQTQTHSNELGDEPYELTLADRWIHAQCQQTIDEVHKAFKNYRFDLVANTLYEFIWHEFCDWYLELTKPTLTQTTVKPALARGTRHTLISVFETLLRLLHPIMPFITEEIWQRVAPIIGSEQPSILLCSYPTVNKHLQDEAASNEIAWLKQVIIAVRTIRAQMNIAPGKPLPIILQAGTEQDKQRIKIHGTFLQTLARISQISWLADDTTAPTAATALVDTLEILIPLADIIDPAVEKARLTKEINKATKAIEQANQRLNNPNYTEKAPAHLVAATTKKLNDATAALELLEKKLMQLEQLAP